MEEVIQPTIKVFYSYAREDISLRDELEKHLGILKRRGCITNWHDRDISAGNEWKQEIDANLASSDIILLLVSPDFIHSDYSYGMEMKQALEKHKAGEARAIPIILRPVDWEDAPFSDLLALPTDAKPITTWPIRDEAFLDVAKGIRKVVNDLLVEKYLSRAGDLYDEDQFEMALVACEHAIRLDPTAHKAYRLKTEILIQLGRDEEALITCQRAIDIAPSSADYSFKGTILLSLNRSEEALTTYQQAIDLDPLESHRYQTKGEMLFKLGRYEEALPFHRQAVDLAASTAKWLFSIDLGATLFELHRYEEAIVAYDETIANMPIADDALADCRKYKGDALFKLGRYEEALASYCEGEETLTDFYGDNKEPEFLHEVSTFKKGEGDALFELYRYEEALTAYQRAIDLAPDTSAYHERRGDTLYRLKCFEDALAAYDYLIRLTPGAFTAYRKKAMIYEQLERQARNKAIEIEHETGIVTAYAGWISKLDLVSDAMGDRGVDYKTVLNIELIRNEYLEICAGIENVSQYGLSLSDNVTIYLSEENMHLASFVYIDNHTKGKYGIKLPVSEMYLFRKT